MPCDLSQTNKTKQNPKLPRILAQRQHIHTACDAKFIPSGTGRSYLRLSKLSSEAHQLHRASKHSHQLTDILQSCISP